MNKNQLTPLAALKQYFGYDSFRPGQLEIISDIIAGHDTLAVLPTGAGKSLCFQIPALCLGGTTIVISPLISLMQDQIFNLEKRGCKATFINSTLTSDEQNERLTKLAKNHYQFVYVAPEKLASRIFRRTCARAKINFIALDEAHCLSLWGHDFRPAYLEIEDFVDAVFVKKPRPVMAAFTATATKLVIADIIKNSGLCPDTKIIQKSFARPNLAIFIKSCGDEHDKILSLLRLLKRHRGESGIIYVLTRKRARELCEKLNNLTQTLGTPALKFYHGGLDARSRARIQNNFLSGETPVIIATNAFGMGVDKPNVRFVIHDQLSSNLENYYQEIGRAGRDSAKSNCYTLFTSQDLEISHNFIKNSQSPAEQKRLLYQKLAAIHNYLSNQKTCRQIQILNYFDEQTTQKCGCCDICLGEKNQAFFLEKAEKAFFLKLLAKREKIAKNKQLIASSICPALSLNYVATLGASIWQKPQIITGFGNGFLQDFAKDFSEIKTSALENPPQSHKQSPAQYK